MDNPTPKQIGQDEEPEMVKLQEHAQPDEGNTVPSRRRRRRRRDGSGGGDGSGSIDERKFFIGMVALLLVVIAIVLGVTLGRRDKGDDPTEPPIAVDYSTGVSLVTYYGVETVIRSRLARTIVTMEVANALDCSSIHSITLQLPRNARVSSLETTTPEDDCTARGEVQELEKARETFLDMTKQGLPGAYVEEQYSFTHGIQVAIPPLGTTMVKLVLEELLQQRLGKVDFQVPFAPNEDIDQIVFDLTVEDLTGGAVEFSLDLPQYILALASEEAGGNRLLVDTNNNTSANNGTAPNNNEGGEDLDGTGADHTETGGDFLTRFHLDLPNAREYTLPKVLRGSYDPVEIPVSGILATDGKCFEHFFLPSAAANMPMAKNILFLLDVTDATSYQDFSEIKSALMDFIDNALTPDDHFSIQTFGHEGTVKLWGPSPATDSEKDEARVFLSTLEHTGNVSTDVQAAFLEALLRAKRDAEESSDHTANIILAISASYPRQGETDLPKIAKNIYKLNREGTVKIFTVGIMTVQPYNRPSMEFLDAVAIVNGGVSTSIQRNSNVGIASQILTFLNNEIGTVLMSDVNVVLTGGSNTKIFGETQQVFPLLASGSEVVVRGLVESDGGTASVLQALTSAATVEGTIEWRTTSVSDFYPAVTDDSDEDKVSLCFQSYAHNRITRLLQLRDAASFMESDIISDLVNLVDETCDKDLPDCLEAEALSLAIEANVVVKGLTAMVTIDKDECFAFKEDNQVCLDGTTPDESPRGANGGDGRDSPASAPTANYNYGAGGDFGLETDAGVEYGEYDGYYSGGGFSHHPSLLLMWISLFHFILCVYFL